MQLHYFEAIAEARDQQSLYDALLNVVEELDFERFSLTARVPSAVEGGRPATNTIANPPDAFFDQAIDPEVSLQDPVWSTLLRSTRPIVYDQETYVRSATADLWDIQSAYGYSTGIGAALNLGGPRLVFGMDRTTKLPRDPSRMAYLTSQVATVLAYAHDQFGLVLGEAKEGAVALSPQQSRILRLIAEGKSNSVIAQLVGISDHTVNFHVRKLFAKLGVSTRLQAVNIAHGLRLL